ncbi:hypothetical protein D3C84_1311150 [compost metagenome]
MCVYGIELFTSYFLGVESVRTLRINARYIELMSILWMAIDIFLAKPARVGFLRPNEHKTVGLENLPIVFS